MSAADCPGCGLPVATPADAGSWTPDGTVCWRGGRCEVSAADDRAAAVLAIMRRARTTEGLAGEIVDATALADYWRAQATMAAPCVDAVRAITLRLIPGGTGCAVDPERVVAAVDGLRAECDRIDAAASRAAGEYMEAAHGLAIERDAARRAATLAEMERDTLRELTDAMREDNVRLRTLARAVRRERAIRAAWLATLPACATAPAEVVAAEAATGAALDWTVAP